MQLLLLILLLPTAFRGTFNSETVHCCSQALNFTVHEQYEVKKKGDCSVAPSLPVGSTTLVLGTDIACPNCFVESDELSLESGKAYIVAGKCRIGCDGHVAMELSGHKTNSLIAKDDGKNVHKYVTKGNKARKCS